jgi:uncharacterized NAD-dependent epimerase/dehydratase family protein
MDIINGLHQFFSEDREFVHTAARNAVQIKDIRKPPQLKICMYSREKDRK